MRLGEYLDNGGELIAIVGGTRSGKSALAGKMHEKYGGQLVHVRDFYREVMVPLYSAQTGSSPGGSFRDMTVAAADWFYAMDPAAMTTLLREHLEITSSPVIIEGFRVKGDLVALPAQTRYVCTIADIETRAQRMLAEPGIDRVASLDHARSTLRHLDEKYGVPASIAYAVSRGATLVDTSRLFGSQDI